PEALVQIIQGVGGITHIAEQLFPGNPRQTGLAAFLKALQQTAIRQLGNDQELVVDDLDALEGEEEGMADRLDALEGLELLFGARFVEVAVNDLERLGQSAGRRCLPDLAEPARAQALDKLVASDNFCAWVRLQGHGDPGPANNESNPQPVKSTAE